MESLRKIEEVALANIDDRPTVQRIPVHRQHTNHHVPRFSGHTTALSLT